MRVSVRIRGGLSDPRGRGLGDQRGLINLAAGCDPLAAQYAPVAQQRGGRLKNGQMRVQIPPGA